LVELTPAVVGYDDTAGAVFHRQVRVVRREHSLDYDRESGDPSQPGQVFPGDARIPDGQIDVGGLSGQRRGEMRHRDTRRHLEAIAHIRFAAPAYERVDREVDRPSTTIFRALDELLGESTILAHIELEPPSSGVFRDFLHGNACGGSQSEDDVR